jgi:Sugar (and other) transporter
MVLSSGCTPFVADSLGRKLILLFSAGGMVIAHAFLGLFFYLDAIESDIIPSITWLPIVSLVVFVFVYCVG